MAKNIEKPKNTSIEFNGVNKWVKAVKPKKIHPTVEPIFMKGVWSEEEEDELRHYTDWHGQHPRCTTPREIKREQALIGEQRYDEEDNTMYYVPLGKADYSSADAPQYRKKTLGDDGEMSVVTQYTHQFQYNEYQSLLDDDDPWFIMSVKDQLEQSHIDGDHTTVKTRVKKKKKLTDTEREIERKKRERIQKNELTLSFFLSVFRKLVLFAHSPFIYPSVTHTLPSLISSALFIVLSPLSR
jgi:hypothetical protein